MADKLLKSIDLNGHSYEIDAKYLGGKDISDIENCVKITYARLKSLRDSSKLIPGKQYRITDYITTTAQENTKSAGHQFDIIVTADDVNRLNEKARAIHHEGDTYFKDSNLSAWEIWYCLDNDTNRFPWASTTGSGVIYRMIDEFNNDCPYDFKNIKFKRYKLNEPTNYNGDVGRHKRQYENIIQAFNANTLSYIWSGIHDADYCWDTEDVIVSTIITSYTFTYFYTFTYYNNNNTIIDISLNNNTGNEINCHSNVIKNSYNLNNIVFLTNTYGYCKSNTFGNDCDFITFGNYCRDNTFGNNCHGITFGNGCRGNTFGNDCDFITFGNDCRFNIFGNDCHGIAFGNTCQRNTFGNGCGNNTFGNTCHSNSFGNECYSNSFGNSCSYNSFGIGCYSNSFGSGCNYNSFGNECNFNSFGISCISNSFGNYCCSNSFGINCCSNSFGNDCNSNSFGNGCSSNSFGNECNFNSFGIGCIFNSFGIGCSSNSFGNGCYYNSFGNGCSSNSFGKSPTNLNSYYRYITFDNGNSYINLNCTETTGSSNYYQNVRIGLGFNNNNSYKTIEDSNVGQAYETVYGKIIVANQIYMRDESI